MSLFGLGWLLSENTSADVAIKCQALMIVYY